MLDRSKVIDIFGTSYDEGYPQLIQDIINWIGNNSDDGDVYYEVFCPDKISMKQGYSIEIQMYFFNQDLQTLFRMLFQGDYQQYLWENKDSDFEGLERDIKRAGFNLC